MATPGENRLDMTNEADSRQEILLLGDPILRKVCPPVRDLDSAGFRKDGQRLLDALEQFRAEHGFGRAIAAPQIGIVRRMIAMNLGEGPFLLVNPEITVLGSTLFTLWDDCMSFPWLMVRLERHHRIGLRFLDDKGTPVRWDSVAQAVSELVQHEVDHLNGILAVDHALDRDSIIARSVYMKQREYFDSLVDYTIQPTTPTRL